MNTQEKNKEYSKENFDLLRKKISSNQATRDDVTKIEKFIYHNVDFIQDGFDTILYYKASDEGEEEFKTNLLACVIISLSKDEKYFYYIVNYIIPSIFQFEGKYLYLLDIDRYVSKLNKCSEYILNSYFDLKIVSSAKTLCKNRYSREQIDLIVAIGNKMSTPYGLFEYIYKVYCEKANTILLDRLFDIFTELNQSDSSIKYKILYDFFDQLEDGYVYGKEYQERLEYFLTKTNNLVRK